MAHDRKSRLQEFVDWAAAHITGDEIHPSPLPFRERATVRVHDRLLQAFHQKGLLEVGGIAEFRIRKAKEDGGGTAFADYVWKPHNHSAEQTAPSTSPASSNRGMSSNESAKNYGFVDSLYERVQYVTFG